MTQGDLIENFNDFELQTNSTLQSEIYLKNLCFHCATARVGYEKVIHKSCLLHRGSCFGNLPYTTSSDPFMHPVKFSIAYGKLILFSYGWFSATSTTSAVVVRQKRMTPRDGAKVLGIVNQALQKWNGTSLQTLAQQILNATLKDPPANNKKSGAWTVLISGNGTQSQTLNGADTYVHIDLGRLDIIITYQIQIGQDPCKGKKFLAKFFRDF